MEDCKHKIRDNKFGVTWYIKCRRLFTKPCGKPLKQEDVNYQLQKIESPVNLKLLEKKLDEALKNETKETLIAFLKRERKK